MVANRQAWKSLPDSPGFTIATIKVTTYIATKRITPNRATTCLEVHLGLEFFLFVINTPHSFFGVGSFLQNTIERAFAQEKSPNLHMVSPGIFLGEDLSIIRILCKIKGNAPLIILL